MAQMLVRHNDGGAFIDVFAKLRARSSIKICKAGYADAFLGGSCIKLAFRCYPIAGI